MFTDKSENMAEYLLKSEFGAIGQGYRLFFLGLTYFNLGKPEKSFNFYYKAIFHAEESYFTQIKGMALNGIAEIYREQEDFETAILYYSKAISYNDKIN